MLSRKTISALISLPVALCAMFSGSVLQLQQLYAKHIMLELLEEKQVTTLSNLKENQYTWTDEGREMLINGALFDVKELQKNTDESITVAGLFDENEQAVLMKLENQQNNKSNDSAHNIFSQIFSNILGLPQTGYHLSKTFSNIPNRHFCHSNSSLMQAEAEVLTPPPQG